MIPIKLSLETSRGQNETYNVEVAKDDFLTPILLNMTVYNSLTATERGLGDTTVSISGEIKLKNQTLGKNRTSFQRRDGNATGFGGGFDSRQRLDGQPFR